MKILYSILIIIISTWILSCANIVPPSGGPKDERPPKMKSVTPADGQTNIRPKKITLIFDKYMELDNASEKISISPLLERKPTVLSYGKKVVISIDDTLLLPNTTYTINLGNALKDNREGTPYPNFTYKFSTGDYFDSLKLKGDVINAHTSMPDTGATVMLYDYNSFTDSAVFKKKPLYTTKVSSNGSFVFDGLPAKNFKIIALTSRDNSLNYVPGQDWFAFRTALVNPTIHRDSSIRLLLFKEDKVIEEYTSATTTGIGRSSLRGSASSIPTLSEKDSYKVLVDTINQKTGTLELNKPLQIITNKKFGKVDQNKIFLSFDKEGVELQSSYSYERQDTIINLHNKWIGNTVYTLRLVKGWATDTNGVELPPSKYQFRTKKEDEYGSMSLKFPEKYIKNSYILQLSLNEDSIALLPINDSVLNFSMLKPGSYTALLIKDWDNNGKFTTGDYLLGRQPEPVTTRSTPLIIKAGWTHEYDIEEKKNEKKPTLR